MQPGVAVADRPQPAGVHRPRLHRLPGQVEVPLALVVAVQAAGVEAGHVAPELTHRLPDAQPLHRHRAGGAHQGVAVHVEPGGVEHQPRQLGGPAVVGPQRQGQATGRVRGGDDVVVTVADGDPVPGGVQVGEVLGQVGHVVGRLVLAQGAAVLAQVDRVEVVAAGVPPLGELGLEEVVGEPVDVEHRLAGRRRPRRGGPAWRRRGPRRPGGSGSSRRCTALPGRRSRRSWPHPVRLARARRRSAAARTRPASRPTSAAVSGCHCTATQNRSPATSIASSVPSAAWADGDEARVGAHRLVVVAVHRRARSPTSPGDPGAGHGGHLDPRRTRRRPGLCCSWPTRSGVCWSRVPPACTAISCMPRQTPSTGSPTAAGGVEERRPPRRPGRGASPPSAGGARRRSVRGRRPHPR